LPPMTPLRIDTQALRDLRLAAGLTRLELADELGISRGHYWRLETGRRYGKDHTFIALARFFQVPVSRFTTEREPAEVAA
jgi:transcriptional regulator with XRE-family HTH domain